MISELHPYRLLNLTTATHEFRHNGNPNSNDYQFFYRIKHFQDGKTIKWQWQDIQNYLDRNKK
ncbi:hypothetical protein R5P91_08765 [Oenococcus oeni]|uniref:Uncharacterized protein n=5 Tax=root TaxID=1 RepID=V9QJ80_9CAUD|nr:hypothetical protein [Oenococcus oeni]YP_009005160.1 hypothetical protein CF77_gp51 [Oenococcus phage phi9805]YP_009005215.1 hypothetical protein CF85_gp50 [Oenococcus phage phiS13]YP_009006547.1 hypothetical protein CF81_gp55 [Oenococcus phage phiS11]AHB80306.1 hypothetical protein [Oenococcus phage phiS11]AHB80365.1 hypothetical protein [Oenococcus phage phiS13]AHC30314.1 hypothetical protein [Oenococcus phage phi9805]EFD87410.1 hypothetical protein AWRIB429_2070 [Oenococcus oeni AWRIB4